MPQRISKELKHPNQIASAVVASSTVESAESTPLDTQILSRVMAEMGRKGGKIGGERSMETMSPKDRKLRVKKAAKARWEKQPA
jgi:hypothetical protein